MNIKDLKIGTRLGIGFGVICLALVVTVGQGVTSLAHLNEATDTIVTKRMPRVELSSRLLVEVNDIAIALPSMMLSDDAAYRAKQVDEIVSSRKDADTILAELDKTLQSQKGRALLARQQALNARYVTAQLALMRLIEANNADEAKAYLAKEVQPLLVEYKKLIDEQIQMQKGLAAQDAGAAAETYANARNLMLALGALVLAGAALLSWRITSSITRPMRRALALADAVAAGDLTADVEADSTCEVGQLLMALKTMNDNLVRTVGTVRAGTEATPIVSLTPPDPDSLGGLKSARQGGEAPDRRRVADRDQ